MSLIVIGTDTDIGKTVVSALVLARYASFNPLAYWKPIATGSAEGRDTEFVRQLCGERVAILPECYLFEPPVSPHLAARLAGKTIDPEKVMENLRAHRQNGHTLVVEGIGGLLVPLTEAGYLLADLIKEMDLGCLLVASTRVGTINHTLLTLEALRQRKIRLAGVLLNGVRNEENRRAIERFGKATIVGEIPWMNPLSGRTLAEAVNRLDPEGLLEPYLRKDRGIVET